MEIRDFRAKFDQQYRERILGQDFFEDPSYYHQNRSRYRWTVQRILSEFGVASPRVLEVGGGQIAILMNGLVDSPGVVVDISETWSEPIRRHGIEFVVGDLVRDELDFEGFDLVVLCEVIEHLPIPGHLVLEKILRWLKPGGKLFLTTPNLYRLRNVLRLALGMQMFCPLRYPPRGNSIGHPFEYSPKVLEWHLKEAGFEFESLEHRQLLSRGATPAASLARIACSPLLALPRFRDNLVVIARRPTGDREKAATTPEIPSIVQNRYLEP